MKSSSNREPNQGRPQIRTASLSRNTGAPAAGSEPVVSMTGGMFREEPYTDLDAQETEAPEEVPFDYSLMGRPNSSAVMPKKRSGSSASRQRPAQAKRAPSKAPARKKKSGGSPAKAFAVVIGFIAIVAGVIGLMFAFGVFKPRIEVVMADGTMKKIKAESAYAELTEGNKYYEGTVINDINVAGMTREEAYAAVSKGLEAAPLNVNIDLKVKDLVYDLDMSSLSLSVNTQEVLDEAYKLNRPTNPEDFDTLTKCYNEYQRMKNVPAVFQTAYTCSTDGLTDLVHGVLDPLEVTEKNAVITDFNKSNNAFVIEPEVIGLRINCDKAVEDVTSLLEERQYEGVVEVETTDVQPEVTMQFINENFGRISSCTSTTTKNRARNNNISQACQYIDGTIINPGEQFSYNETVGERTEARGFQEATVINGGQYDQGMGGGVCQVSTMVYGAAVKANLEIVSRKPHAWPSNYVDPGLDATVDWGRIDFVFRNNTDYQVVIRAEFDSSNNAVIVSIYGKKLPEGQHIDFIAVVNSTTPHGDAEYIARPDLPVGEKNTVRNAHDGMNITSYKVWFDANGNEIKREEVATTNYRMYVKRVELGTKLPGGGQAKIDPATGKVITPTNAPTATPTPKPTSTPKPTKPADPTKAPPTETPDPPEGGGDD